MQESKMYSLRIEDLIREETNAYVLVVASAQLARATAGAAAEAELKPTTKALTDLVEGIATYDYRKSK